MATQKKKRSALSSAVQTLAQGGTPIDQTLNASEKWDPSHAKDTLRVGKLGLAADAEVIERAVGAMRALDVARMSFATFGDVIYAKGIRAADLRGEKANPEILGEVRDLIGALRFSSEIVGGKVLIEHLRVVWHKRGLAKGSPVPTEWTLMAPDTRKAAARADGQVGTYLSRLIEALAAHDEAKKKGPKVPPTIEEQYLSVLGPVLLFLQGIDQTRVDPKFDWKVEFDAISAAVSRAKQAQTLALAARRA